MTILKISICVFLVFALPELAGAAELRGIVVDPSNRPISGAQVAVFTPSGVVTQQITGDDGSFDIYVSPLLESVQLRVTALGFQTVEAGMGASRIRLALAPQSDSIRVIGSAIDEPASRQGSSVSVIESREIRERNEAQAADLMREIPVSRSRKTGLVGP